MKPEKVFNRYDIRGLYPEEIDEEFAEALGKAVGTFAARNYSGKVVVSRDNKESSSLLKEDLLEGLKSTGVHVIDVGEGPTDFAAFSGKERNAVSVQVTSSHKPLEFNGFKLMYPEGNGFTNNDLDEVQRIFLNEDFENGRGYREKDREALGRYTDRLKSFARQKEGEWKGKKIVVESLGGTAEILPEILEDLGAEVIDLNDREGIYVDPPDPKPRVLQRLANKVDEEDAYIGIANDLDADRVKVYFDGRFISGNEVFGVLAQLFEEPFVGSVDTSKIIEEFGELKYTRLGDPFVMSKALEINAELAGEPNGHFAITEFVPYNSGILTGIILSGLELENYLEEVPELFSNRKSIKTVEKEKKMKRVEKVVKERHEIESDIDGVKYRDESNIVLIRASGTSPKIRIFVESTNEEEMRQAMEKAEELVRNA